MKRTVYFISDGTGITAETLGNSLLTQFEHVEFEKITIPYIDTVIKADEIVRKIGSNIVPGVERPVIFATLVDPLIRDVIDNAPALVVDFFNTFMHELELELHSEPSKTVGRSHGVVNTEVYNARIDAIHFALATDDGANTRKYEDADLILLGVSRSGKTPTSLYLALQYGIRAANYPFTEDDLTNLHLPANIKIHKEKLFGLTIDPHRLQAIRNERRPNSRYSSRLQCQLEISEIEKLFHSEKISFINTTTLSIEEISAKIMAEKGLKRRI